MIAKQQAKREQSHLVYLHTVDKYKKVGALIHRMIMKQVKNEQIKRKQTCSVCFVKYLTPKKVR